jgi:hypothetical protein
MNFIAVLILAATDIILSTYYIFAWIKRIFYIIVSH